MEFFKYMIDLLKERGASHIKVFGGGGGVIVPREIRELEAYGVAKIFSPEDGRKMGLQGMINHMLREADFPTVSKISLGSGPPRRRGSPRHRPADHPGGAGGRAEICRKRSMSLGALAEQAPGKGQGAGARDHRNRGSGEELPDR